MPKDVANQNDLLHVIEKERTLFNEIEKQIKIFQRLSLPTDVSEQRLQSLTLKSEELFKLNDPNMMLIRKKALLDRLYQFNQELSNSYVSNLLYSINKIEAFIKLSDKVHSFYTEVIPSIGLFSSDDTKLDKALQASKKALKEIKLMLKEPNIENLDGLDKSYSKLNEEFINLEAAMQLYTDYDKSYQKNREIIESLWREKIRFINKLKSDENYTSHAREISKLRSRFENMSENKTATTYVPRLVRGIQTTACDYSFTRIHAQVDPIMSLIDDVQEMMDQPEWTFLTETIKSLRQECSDIQIELNKSKRDLNALQQQQNDPILSQQIKSVLKDIEQPVPSTIKFIEYLQLLGMRDSLQSKLVSQAKMIDRISSGQWDDIKREEVPQVPQEQRYGFRQKLKKGAGYVVTKVGIFTRHEDKDESAARAAGSLPEGHRSKVRQRFKSIVHKVSVFRHSEQSKDEQHPTEKPSKK